MAEALAAVGVAASIAQLADVGLKVVARLHEFHTRLNEVPKCFEHIVTQLPLLLDTLKATQGDMDAGVIGSDTEKALVPVVNGCRLQIESLDTIVGKLLPLAGDKWAARSKKALSSLKQESKVEHISTALRGYIQTLIFYHSAVQSSFNPKRDDKLEKIRHWLAAPDPSVNYQKALKLRQSGTGLWFLEGERYTQWQTSPASTLWLYGIPGCGKSVLSATIVEDTLRHSANDPGKAVAYFYFDFKDTRKQSPELMVRSLVTQLSQQCIRVPPRLDSLFGSSNNGQWQPSLDGLLESLQQMCEDIPNTYIVLDALDECTERDELMGVIERIAGWQLPTLHLILTSRKERDIEEALEPIVNDPDIVALQSELVNEDIRKYVRHRLSVDKKLKKWEGGESQAEIEAAIMKGAKGMFRWAVCQLDALQKCTTRAMLRKALSSLPRTLDETYERILCGIDEDHAVQAQRLLRWIAFSERPLTPDELAVAVAIDPEIDPAFHEEEVFEDPLDILSICASLVTVAPWYDSVENNVLQTLVLAHYSVKEYLVSDRIKEGRAHTYSLQERTCNIFLADSCIGYLLQFTDSESLGTTPFSSHKLLKYSARYWWQHAISHRSTTDTEAESTQKLLWKLFSDPDGAYLSWLRLFDPDRARLDFRPSLAKHDAPQPLYLASFFGFLDTLARLLRNHNVDVNAEGGRFGSALQAAVGRGRGHSFNLLLKAGADINAQGGHYGNALQAACYQGDIAVVNTLIQAGADVNAQGGPYGNALQAACYQGDIVVVNTLIQARADVNAQGGFYGNALQAACEQGDIAVVNTLIQAGADISAQGGFYGNALQAACEQGDIGIVNLLLGLGADINAQGGQYGNALQAACWNGYIAIVELLLGLGAEINAQGGYFGNALIAATEDGKKETVMLLLEAGADVMARSSRNHTPLHVAFREGREDIAKLLLEAGADVNARDQDDKTPLHCAVNYKDEENLRLFLEAGTALEVHDEDGRTPLDLAKQDGDDEMVEILLEAGARDGEMRRASV